MEENKPKTFEEIDAKLQADLKQIGLEIAEIENHLQIGQQMFDEAVAQKKEESVIQKYQKGLEELQKGLEMFLSIQDEIRQTIEKLHDTQAKADEYIGK